MKNILFAVVAVSLLAACSSPVLRWIDTPAEGAVGRITGQNWDKEILAFDFPDISGEDVIIGGEPQPDGKYPIVAVIPRNSAASLSDEIPAITYRGSSISPGPSTPENFSNPLIPVIYTVTAKDRSTREYAVKVVLKEDDDYSKQITGFFFTDPLVEGVIDETSQTIALTVPWGTNLMTQRPEVFYTGVSVNPVPGRPVDFSAASISPSSGKSVGPEDRAGKTPVRYTVHDKGGFTRSYDVWVFPVAAPVLPEIGIPDTSGGTVDKGTATDGNGNYNTTVIVEFPVNIENPVININYPGAGNTVNIGSIDTTINADSTINLENNNVMIDNSKVVNLIPIQVDNGEYIYVLVVNGSTSSPDSNAASIDAFYFTSPVAIGTIGKTDGTEGTGTPEAPYKISVTVPYGKDLHNLSPVICYTGKEIVGVPGTNPLKGSVRSFTGPVDYTVKATDGTTTKTYRVTVTVAPNTAKEITAFTFSGISAEDTGTIIGAGPNADGKYPIEITIPAGQPLTELTPVITHTGKSITGPTGGPNTGNPPVTDTSRNFSSPVDYTVTAQDGTERIYTVRVRNADDDDIEITGFYFTNPLAVGAVHQDTNTITVQVPSKTNPANLVPAVYFRGMSIKPNSGTANDFSGPVVYTVTGRNGKTRSYTVTVNNTASVTKDIIRFDFPEIEDVETVIGAVPGNDGNYPISVWVPPGTDLTALPDIAHTGVDIDCPEGTPDFSGPVDYTVTAEDGSEKTYTVRVYIRDGDTMLITSLIFNDIPLAGGRTLRVVASIDQDNHTITAVVPYTANISSIKPVITYIGRSIAGPTGGDKTVNPFTGAARNFTAPQSYTVKSQGGGTRTYTVTVLRQSSVTAQFEGEADRSIIASYNFDQNTGVITVIAKNDAGGVSPPYTWYVDGIIQAVSATNTTFTLDVGAGNFTPGRHEIMLSGIKDGLHYTGRVYFTAAGGSK